MLDCDPDPLANQIVVGVFYFVRLEFWNIAGRPTTLKKKVDVFLKKISKEISSRRQNLTIDDPIVSHALLRHAKRSTLLRTNFIQKLVLFLYLEIFFKKSKYTSINFTFVVRIDI